MAKILLDPNAPTNSKIQAALGVLKFGREGIELEDLAERVNALEAAAKAAVEQAQQQPQRFSDAA